MHVHYHQDKHQDPAKKKVRFKKLRPCSHQAKFRLFCKKCVDREPFQCERLFSSARIFSTVTKVQRTELNLLPLVLDRELKDLFFYYKCLFGSTAFNVLEHKSFISHSCTRQSNSCNVKTPEPVLLRLPILIVLLNYGLLSVLLLSNSENRERLKNFRNVDCVLANYYKVQDTQANHKLILPSLFAVQLSHALLANFSQHNNIP